MPEDVIERDIRGISNIILRVGDLRQSVGFYRDVLGLTLKFEVPGWAFFDCGGLTLALNESKTAAIAPSSQSTEVVFDTEDIHAAYAALGSRGVAFTRAPRVVTTDATHDTLATDFRDPDGHAFSIMGRVEKGSGSA